MNQRLFEELIKEEQQSISGWNLSYLKDSERMMKFPLQWKFSNVLKPYLDECDRLLQMGTKDKEMLISVSSCQKQTRVTMSDEADATVGDALKSLGVEVIPVLTNDLLPFEDEAFDLIINKHESFDASEIERLLHENGYFITEQVGGLNDCELNLWLNVETSESLNKNFRSTINSLRDAGLTIVEEKEDISRTRFYDLGAIVYYLKSKRSPIRDFSVEKYFDRLQVMKGIIDQQGYIDLTKHRFLMIVKKVKHD